MRPIPPALPVATGRHLVAAPAVVAAQVARALAVGQVGHAAALDEGAGVAGSNTGGVGGTDGLGERLGAGDGEGEEGEGGELHFGGGFLLRGGGLGWWLLVRGFGVSEDVGE